MQTPAERSTVRSKNEAHVALAAGAELHSFEEAEWEAFNEHMPSGGSNMAAGLMMPKEVRSSRPAPAWRRIS